MLVELDVVVLEVLVLVLWVVLVDELVVVEDVEVELEVDVVVPLPSMYSTNIQRVEIRTSLVFANESFAPI